MTTVYTVNNKVLKNSATDKWLKKPDAIDYNPYNLPAKTFRVKLGSSWAGDPSITATQVEGDIYDITFPSDSAINSFSKSAVIGLLGANGTGLTSVPSSLTSLTGAVGNLYLPDTTSLFSFFVGSSISSIGAIYAPNVTMINEMCTGNSNLTAVPDLDVSNVTLCKKAFYGCTSVESGALTLYNKLAALGAQVIDHQETFAGCGSNTVTGAAELAQIPSSWGGTGS